MSLSTALNIAQNSLLNTGRQTSVLSRNVQEANSTDYSRRNAVLVSTAPGARVIEIQRSTNDQLFRQNLAALSSQNAQTTLSDGLEQLQLQVNGVDDSSSAASALSNLQQALQLYSATPSNSSLATSVVDAAKQVVSSLNAGTSAIQSFRADADKQIGDAVSQLNTLLSQFKDVNDQIVAGTSAGRDVSDALDQRDALLKQISAYVPVSTMTRANNDMALTTAGGVTLFETLPRAVTFQTTPAYAAGTSGNSVYVDGMPVALASGGNTGASGKIAGLLQLRDGVANTMQSQLDEVARGLITAFRETGSSVPDQAGLFTWSGGPAVPASGTVVDGLAGSIRINAAFDGSSGGNAALLRDGGANGSAYVSNTDGAASYSDQIMAYMDRLDAPMAFDTSAGAGTNVSVADYASASIGWFQGIRKDASDAAETKAALASRTQEALSNATGVNVDTEMSLMLDLEHSYQASSRLIKAVDDMLSSLMAAIG